VDTNPQLVELIVFRGQYLLDLLFIHIFFYDLLRKKFTLSFHNGRKLMDLLLRSWS